MPRRTTGFNPRPLLLTGESGGEALLQAGYDGFNPRPLLLTGESLALSRVVAFFDVSIHARYC